MNKYPIILSGKTCDEINFIFSVFNKFQESEDSVIDILCFNDKFNSRLANCKPPANQIASFIDNKTQIEIESCKFIASIIDAYKNARELPCDMHTITRESNLIKSKIEQFEKYYTTRFKILFDSLKCNDPTVRIICEYNAIYLEYISKALYFIDLFNYHLSIQ